MTVASQQTSFASLLRFWRKQKGLSQLALAEGSEVSTRHISFLETDKAQPSHEMVIDLANTMQLDMRQTNGLLMAAGFPALYGALPLDAPEMKIVGKVLSHVLARSEPFPALVFSRTGQILKLNQAMRLFFQHFAGADVLNRCDNAYLIFFKEEGFRNALQNWPELLEIARLRLREELSLSGELPLPPDLVGLLQNPDANLPSSEPGPILTIQMKTARGTISFFTVISTIGTAHDITVQDLRMETFFPADEFSEAWFKDLPRMLKQD